MQRGKIFPRGRAVSGEPGHLFYVKGGKKYVDFWAIANSLAIWSEAWKGKDWKMGDMEVQSRRMWMNLWECVKSFVLHVNDLHGRGTENPGLYLDCLQPIAEHSGIARADPYLLNTGLL